MFFLLFLCPVLSYAVISSGTYGTIIEGANYGTPVVVQASNIVLFEGKKIYEIEPLTADLLTYIADFLNKRVARHKIQKIYEEISGGHFSEEAKEYFLRDCEGRFYRVTSTLTEEDFYVAESFIQIEEKPERRSTV